MIDLHCHILPGIDDGAPDLETSLAMARIACNDGIHTIACTPHIYPGMYENSTEGIQSATEDLRIHLANANISLCLTFAADAHAVPELREHLRTGTVPTLNGGRYFLLEPPHHIAPPRFDEFVFNLMIDGYVPIITHPERLHWIEDHYRIFKNLALKGAWMQLTAGSLTGRFGKNARYWSERMLDDGLVHVLATDSHSADRRPPLLAEGREAASHWVGKEEANRLVNDRPVAALENTDPVLVTAIPALSTNQTSNHRSLFKRALSFMGLNPEK